MNSSNLFDIEESTRFENTDVMIAMILALSMLRSLFMMKRDRNEIVENEKKKTRKNVKQEKYSKKQKRYSLKNPVLEKQKRTV